MTLDFAPELRAKHAELYTLPSGRTVEIPVCRVAFQPWAGKSPLPKYGNKPVLNLDGEGL